MLVSGETLHQGILIISTPFTQRSWKVAWPATCVAPKAATVASSVDLIVDLSFSRRTCVDLYHAI